MEAGELQFHSSLSNTLKPCVCVCSLELTVELQLKTRGEALPSMYKTPAKYQHCKKQGNATKPIRPGGFPNSNTLEAEVVGSVQSHPVTHRPLRLHMTHQNEPKKKN